MVCPPGDLPLSKKVTISWRESVEERFFVSLTIALAHWSRFVEPHVGPYFMTETCSHDGDGRLPLLFCIREVYCVMARRGGALFRLPPPLAEWEPVPELHVSPFTRMEMRKYDGDGSLNMGRTHYRLEMYNGGVGCR